MVAFGDLKDFLQFLRRVHFRGNAPCAKTAKEMRAEALPLPAKEMRAEEGLHRIIAPTVLEVLPLTARKRAHIRSRMFVKDPIPF